MKTICTENKITTNRLELSFTKSIYNTSKLDNNAQFAHFLKNYILLSMVRG